MMMMRTFTLAEAVSKIPGALEEMLVRGAYLEHSARQLEHVRNEQTVRVQTVRDSQPPFLFLRPRDTRAAFKLATQDGTQDLSKIEQALFINQRLCEHLRRRSEELLEKWLRTHCDEYRLGLAAGHFAVDWEQALHRFTEHAKAFISALGAARNMAPAGYDRGRGVYSQGAYESISHAHAAALKVEAEIIATNAVAVEHDSLLGKTVFNDPMPRLVLEPYAEVVAQIAGMPPMLAQQEFDRVIMACDDLIHRELGAVRNRVRESARVHTGRTHSYVSEAWNQLHAHAMAHSVSPEHLEAVVAQTEQTYHADALLATT